MIDEKKLLAILEQWRDACTEAKIESRNVSQFAHAKYEGHEWILDSIIDGIKKGYYNND